MKNLLWSLKHKHFFIIPLLFLVGCTSTNAIDAAEQDSPTKVVPQNTVESLVLDPSATAGTDQPADYTDEEPTETMAPQLVNGYLTKIEQTLLAENQSELDPYQWSSWPVIPDFNPYLLEVYQRGLSYGNHAERFSVLGDCQSLPNVFLGIYESVEVNFAENEADLYDTIDYYEGSFSHESVTVIDGLSPPTALSAMWNDPQRCQVTESPLACEIRINKPSIMFINMGSNWRADASTDDYEKYLRMIIEESLAQGVVPVLSTKADNVEGGHRINALTVRIASEYQIPIWNFWQAANLLENHGLDANRESVYLSVEAWGLRSHVALKTLHALHRFLEGQD